MSSYLEEEGIALLRVLYENPTAPIAVDTETTGLKVADGTDRCIGISIAALIDDKPYKHYFGINHSVGENISKKTLEMLLYVLFQPRTLIFANPIFDILSIETLGYRLDDADFVDICTMAHFIDENKPISKALDSLSLHYLGEAGKLSSKEIEDEKTSGWKHTTPEQMWDYAVTDAVTTYRVWMELLKQNNWKELPDDFWSKKQEFIRVLIQMRRRGVLIDQELAKEMVETGENELRRLGAELGYPAVPTKKDPNPLPKLGPIALEEIFLQKLGLPVLKRGKPSSRNPEGNPSFDKSVMEQYDEILERMDSKEARLVKDYRGWQKAVSASYRPYLELVDADGRLRCSYKTHGTVTGRLSCSEPNLQQIPKTSDKPWNGRVKECFIAKEGYVLINADFSQLELRLATAYAGEQQLAKVFEEGRDIFSEMAKQLEMVRQDTKTLVYSMQYGAGIKRIMGAFGVSRQRAADILNNYIATYPRFKAFADICENRARTTGRVRIWSGRYRHFQYPSSEGYKAMNSVIQGGAADIVERVMVRCFKELDGEDCQMLLQVHDSITFEVREELAEEYTAKIKEVMEDVTAAVGEDLFPVKFAVEVGPWVA